MMSTLGSCPSPPMKFIPAFQHPPAIAKQHAMADDQTHYPGGHYSGRNKIPTVDKFLQSLDRDKKARDEAIDKELQDRNHADVKHQQPASAAQKGKEVSALTASSRRLELLYLAN